jgi:DNA-binding transcriptional MerR regulator
MASEASTETAARLSEAAAARECGISRQAVHEWVKRGLIAKGPDGLLCAREVQVLRAGLHPSSKASAPPTVPSPATPPEPAVPASDDAAMTSYHVAKTLREAAEARIAQLKLAELQGQLVRAADIQAELSRIFATFREAMQQIPNRLAAVLAAETDQARVHDALDVEIRNALMHLKERV